MITKLGSKLDEKKLTTHPEAGNFYVIIVKITPRIETTTNLLNN